MSQLSAAGFGSAWRVVPVCCCSVTSMVLAPSDGEQLTWDIVERCPDVGSALCGVAACSPGWSTLAAFGGGFGAASAAGGQFVAGDWNGFSECLMSTVEGWVAAACGGTPVRSESLLWVNCWCWSVDSGSFSRAS